MKLYVLKTEDQKIIKISSNYLENSQLVQFSNKTEAIKWAKTQKIEVVQPDDVRLKAEEEDLLSKLKSTDWYVVRQAETQTPIPQEILDQRAQARLRISEIREELEQLKTTN